MAIPLSCHVGWSRMQASLGRCMTLGMRWPSAAETIHEGADKGCLTHTQKQQALHGRILYCINVHHAVGAGLFVCFFLSTEGLMASLLRHGKNSVWRQSLQEKQENMVISHFWRLLYTSNLEKLANDFNLGQYNIYIHNIQKDSWLCIISGGLCVPTDL